MTHEQHPIRFRRAFRNPELRQYGRQPHPFQARSAAGASTVDFKADLKKLFGQYQMAAATARGKLEVNCKAKLAVFDLGFAEPAVFRPDAHQRHRVSRLTDSEAGAIPGQLHVHHHCGEFGASGFVDDLGVVYAASGKRR
jgi:hypothetical protein